MYYIKIQEVMNFVQQFVYKIRSKFDHGRGIRSKKIKVKKGNFQNKSRTKKRKEEKRKQNRKEGNNSIHSIHSYIVLAPAAFNVWNLLICNIVNKHNGSCWNDNVFCSAGGANSITLVIPGVVVC